VNIGVIPSWAKSTYEWSLISLEYGDRVAERSRVPLINHIVEGVNVLEAIGSNRAAICAFMVHPLFQADDDFERNGHILADPDLALGPEVSLLVLEYRRAANAYLSKPHTDDWSDAIVRYQVGALYDSLRNMLVADKWQNQKDFRAHHLGTHARSAELERYFLTWQRILDPTDTVWPMLNRLFQ